MHLKNNNMNVFLTPVKDPNGAWRKVLLSGIEDSPDKKLCNDLQISDVCLIDTHRSSLKEVEYYRNLCIKHKVPFIGVDYSDEARLKHYVDGFFRFFKRSNVKRINGFSEQLIRRDEGNIYPISYCGRVDFLPIINSNKIYSRDIDISCFFGLSNNSEGNYTRSSVSQHLFEFNKHNKSVYCHVGLVGENGHLGRENPQVEYVKMLLRSKICVTANPDRWEGDWRFWEAYMTGAFVLIDVMLQPPSNLIRGVDYDFYSNLSDLTSKINLYLKLDHFFSEKQIKKRIDKCLKHHMPKNRIEYVLDHVR